MAELKYKASLIAKAEKETGFNFLEILTKIETISETKTLKLDFNELLFLVQCGGGSEKEFDELFEKGIEEFVIEVFSAIGESGFLGKKMNGEEMRKLLRETISVETTSKNTETSQTSGEDTSEKPSE